MAPGTRRGRKATPAWRRDSGVEPPAEWTRSGVGLDVTGRSGSSSRARSRGRTHPSPPRRLNARTITPIRSDRSARRASFTTTGYPSNAPSIPSGAARAGDRRWSSVSPGPPLALGPVARGEAHGAVEAEATGAAPLQQVCCLRLRPAAPARLPPRDAVEELDQPTDPVRHLVQGRGRAVRSTRVRWSRACRRTRRGSRGRLRVPGRALGRAPARRMNRVSGPPGPAAFFFLLRVGPS